MKMRTVKEIDDVLNLVDKQTQKMVGDFDVPDAGFRQMATVRTTLLWVKGELEGLD